MICGLGNVVKELEEIKSKVSKTEYEKAREPLNIEILKLQEENFRLREKLKVMQDAFRLIVTGIEDDYIKVIADTSIPKVRFFTGKDDFRGSDYTTAKIVNVPLKSNLISDIKRICEQIERENNE